jgi:hypothetical protein
MCQLMVYRLHLDLEGSVEEGIRRVLLARGNRTAYLRY